MSTFSAALSLHPEPVEALGDVTADLLEDLGEDPPDLLVAFLSPHHIEAATDLAAGLQGLLRPKALIGATTVAVAGGGREVEHAPALSVFAARFDADSEIRTIALEAVPTADGARLDGWPDDVIAEGTLLLLADPFSFPVDDFLALVNAHAPGLQILGGLASAAVRPGGNRLLRDGVASPSGAVGVLLPPSVPVRAVVSQGCRPVGRPFTVTRAEGNRIEELAGRTPIERLREVAGDLEPRDRDLLRRGLHIGIVVDEHRLDFKRGDFLVRNLVGADDESGALAVAERVDVGQTVQFHVRDAASADEDLRLLLDGVDGRAALLFSCNGRGLRLFGVADHDAGLVDEMVGPLPLAGAFCAGEIGPVGPRSHLHGFTASLAVFS